MLVSTLNLYILAFLMYVAHAFSFAGATSAFAVFWLNRKCAEDKATTMRERIFAILSVPALIISLVYMLIPVVSKIEFGVFITPSFYDLACFIGPLLIGVLTAIFMLRSGVQMLEKAKSNLTKSSELERNTKTDVRDLSKSIPAKAVKFDPLSFILKKGDGVFLGLDEKSQPVNIEFGGGTSAPHVQVIGTTGAGKGVSIGLMASQFLELGEAVFFCDPKNDEWAPSVLYAAAQRTGKPYYFIDLNRPAGPQFNIFEGATEVEAFELFQAGFNLVERGDASDFYGIADRREAGVVARLMSRDNVTIAEAYAAQQDVILQSGAEKFYGRLREMAETPSINAKSDGIDLAKVIEEGGCVYIVGSMRSDIVKTAQRMLLVRLIQLAERRDRMRAGELRKICIVLDEVKYHLSRPALEGLGAARDKGVHFILAHQSLGDLKDCTKDLNPDAVVDAVVENCRLKLCYRVQSPVTAQWLASMSGKVQVDDEARTVKRNAVLSETVHDQRTIRQTETYFVDENMLLNLPPQVAVLYGAGLPKFVSIQPLKVLKSPEAIKIKIVAGTTVQSSIDMLDIASPARASHSENGARENSLL
ncbi:type IV secretory system conjugative DNA transfer family protein [Gallionella capsiferriformans]|uniref:TriK protein n=1 Tax=Gallionella capsiferriformans (strain ES-2) TaxID=395494 RepID=D9SGA2_GALCS|nr:TraM recognition domain-containing protein [Gallionella capsiferriformans]ADL55549.1 TriK protein [Gallionella capsiferriformans ES-2]